MHRIITYIWGGWEAKWSRNIIHTLCVRGHFPVKYLTYSLVCT